MKLAENSLCAFVLFAGLSLLAALRAYGQNQPASGEFSLSPNRINLRLNETSTLQLLDRKGMLVPSSAIEWEVEDPAVVQIESDAESKGELFRGLGVGNTKIVARAYGFSAVALITVWKDDPPKGTIRWASPALPGGNPKFSSVLQSTIIDSSTPDFYMSDGARIRAFYQDGRQAWVWPMDDQTRTMDLRAGDNAGGALVFVREHGEEYAVRIDSAGQESWSYRPGKGHHFADHAVAPDGTILVLEDRDKDASQLVAIEEKTGEQKFVTALPPSLRQSSEVPRACALGEPERPTEAHTPSAHGKLFVSSEGVVSVPMVLETDMVWVGPECGATSNSPQNAVQHFRYEQTLEVMRVERDGVPSFLKLDSETYRGTNPNRLVRRFNPRERAIPDDSTGVLLPVITELSSVNGKGGAGSKGYLYRFAEDSSTSFPIPLLPRDEVDAMLIGPGTAFIGGSVNGTRALTAVAIADGSVKWIWHAQPNQYATLYMVTNDDFLIFEGSQAGVSHLFVADPSGHVFPMFASNVDPGLAAATGRNDPSYWSMGQWFGFLVDQSFGEIIGPDSLTPPAQIN